MSFGQKVCNKITLVSVALCIIAEVFCNHAMYTTNTYWNLYETILWTIAIGMLIPVALYMRYLIYLRIPENKYNANEIKIITTLILIAGIVFVFELLFDHIPSQYKCNILEYSSDSN